MAEMTSYKHGTPSWTDLSTTDPDAAASFYSELLGWDVGERGGPEVGGYTMFHKNGKNVAAFQPQQPQQREAGMPPAWTTYITVDSADQTAGKAKQAGGQVLAEPFDVMDAGRMAVVMDPSGAAFGIWQAKQHVGAQLINEPGAMCWNELDTGETEAAAKFYSELLGWSVTPLDGGPMPYFELKRDDGELIGGMLPMPPNAPVQMPSFWMSYFAVEDTDAAVAKAKELGGKALMEPMDIPAGRFAVLQDPQGATFAVIKLASNGAG